MMESLTSLNFSPKEKIKTVKIKIHSNFVATDTTYIIVRLTFSKPITEALLRRDSFGLQTDKLFLGAAPLRSGESGGRRLSNSSGLR